LTTFNRNTWEPLSPHLLYTSSDLPFVGERRPVWPWGARLPANRLLIGVRAALATLRIPGAKIGPTLPRSEATERKKE
jgi:hypothetical protein